MKTKSLLFGTLCLCVVFSSCQKDNLLYSCDPQADAWVKQNITNTQLMTRSSWLELDVNESTKRAAYVSFSPETKKQFWQNKVLEVIEQFEWNDKEIEHLTLLLNYIDQTNVFEKIGTDDDFELFVYKWQEDAIDKLGWTKKLIYSITASGDKLTNKEGDIQISSAIIISPSVVMTNSETGSGSSCACSQLSDFCDIFGEIPSNVVSCNHNNSNCTTTGSGCGIFFEFSCDGICSSPLL